MTFSDYCIKRISKVIATFNINIDFKCDSISGFGHRHVSLAGFLGKVPFGSGAAPFFIAKLMLIRASSWAVDLTQWQ